jgi:protein-histidine pros-kinase
MVAKYGSVNGFGWRLGDVVALQVVEVPSQPSRDKALKSVLVTIASLACVFVLSAVVFLVLLRRHVTSPLERLTMAANAISLNGNSQEPASPAEGGQFAELNDAIVRLKTSVDSALRQIASIGNQRNGPDR